MKKPYKISLDNKVIAITGGYSHLGKAIAECMAENGGEVFILARSKDKFETIFGETNFIEKIRFLETDISKPESLQQSFKEVYSFQNRFDVLVNNAFYLKGQSPTTMDSQDFTYGLEGTLTSVYNCISEALPYLKEGASIINVGSMYGLIAPDFDIYKDSPAFLNPPHYGAAKAGVLQLSRYYASYLGQKGITVNSITPGPFPSEIVQENKEFVAKLEKRTVLGKIGKPEDLAGAFVFLASNAARYITGQNIVVDGGWTIR